MGLGADTGADGAESGYGPWPGGKSGETDRPSAQAPGRRGAWLGGRRCVDTGRGRARVAPLKRGQPGRGREGASPRLEHPEAPGRVASSGVSAPSPLCHGRGQVERARPLSSRLVASAPRRPTAGARLPVQGLGVSLGVARDTAPLGESRGTPRQGAHGARCTSGFPAASRPCKDVAPAGASLWAGVRVGPRRAVSELAERRGGWPTPDLCPARCPPGRHPRGLRQRGHRLRGRGKPLAGSHGPTPGAETVSTGQEPPKRGRAQAGLAFLPGPAVCPRPGPAGGGRGGQGRARPGLFCQLRWPPRSPAALPNPVRRFGKRAAPAFPRPRAKSSRLLGGGEGEGGHVTPSAGGSDALPLAGPSLPPAPALAPFPLPPRPAPAAPDRPGHWARARLADGWPRPARQG